MMEKEDNLEVKVVQQEKNNQLETPGKLLKKPQENGIATWKNAERKNTKVDNNYESILGSDLEHLDILTGQQHFEARRANKSKPLLLSIDDGIDDFTTELTLFNDLVVTNDLKSCNEYLPYYRTYTNLLETHLDSNMNTRYKTIEGEGIQNSSCVFQPEYEDEPLRDMGLASGYFPYYRSYEEYLGSSDLPSEVYNCLDNEEVETSITEELESDIDCEIEEVYEDTIIPESGETNEDTSQSSDSLKLPKSHLFTNSIIEPCDSEYSFFNEITSPNEPSSSRGYFPYYRTYEKMVLSPESSTKMFSSSENALVKFGLEMEGTGDPGDNSNISCSVC